MTRSRSFVKSLLTGYVAIITNILFTVISIPLALAYLGKEEFGLWALALQINGYVGLLDLGLSGTMFRLAADHKDNANGGEYGGLLITGGIAFLVQGILMAAIGWLLAMAAPDLLDLPDHLAGSFTRILIILALISGATFAFKSVASPLWAFQRMEILNISSSATLILRLLLMWGGFHLQWGLDSLVLSMIPPAILSIWFQWWICVKNNYFPARGKWGSPSWTIFKGVFDYSRDGLLLSLGSQLVNATQITIISRVLGLDKAATFSIGTKLYSLAQQLFQKIIESSAPGLTELYIRGDKKTLANRYWEIISVTLAVATIGAVGLTSGNSAFVDVWTSGKIRWSFTSDLMLGILVIATSLSGCFITAFGITRNIKTIRLIFLIEGLVFLPCAIVAAKLFGMEGILAASIVTHILITLAYTIKKVPGVLGSNANLLPALGVPVILLGAAFAYAWTCDSLRISPVIQVRLSVIPVILSVILAFRFVIAADIRSRVIRKILDFNHSR